MILRFLFPFFALLTVAACEPGSQDKSLSPSQTEEKPPDKKSELNITRIPVFDVTIDRNPTPLPFPNVGLQFQRNLPGAQRKANRYRPIGDGRYGPKGHLYLTFPKQDLVIAFRKPHFDLNYYGSTTYGGTGEIIKNPGFIGFTDESMTLTNKDNGQALVLSTKGEFQNALELKLPGAIAGPNNHFLVVSPQNPNAFARVDENVNPIQRYLMNDFDLKEGDDPNMVFHIRDNWEVLAARRSGSRLFHMQANAFFIRHLNLNLNPENNPANGRREVFAVRFINNQYWLLVGNLVPSKPPASLLMVLDPEGKLVHYWQTPFYADGFDLHGDDLLLINKIQGSAETYRRQ